MAYLSDDLLADIKRDSYFPTIQGNWTDAQLLTIADQSFVENIAPLLISSDENYFLEQASTTIVSGTSSYTIDRYAMGLKLKRLDLRYSNGNIRHLARIDISELEQWSLAISGDPQAYYLTNDQIVLIPTPSASAATNYSLLQWIFRRPGQLVRATTSGTNLAGACQVTSAITNTVTYTATAPSTFTNSSYHDFYRGTPPFHRLATAVQSGGIAGSAQIFPVASVALLQPGDWVCFQDQTVFPAGPLELQSFLKELVIKTAAKAQTDAAAYQLSVKEIMERARLALGALPGNRVVGQPKKIPIPLGLLGRRRRVMWSD